MFLNAVTYGSHVIVSKVCPFNTEGTSNKALAVNSAAFDTSLALDSSALHCKRMLPSLYYIAKVGDQHFHHLFNKKEGG